MASTSRNRKSSIERVVNVLLVLLPVLVLIVIGVFVVKAIQWKMASNEESRKRDELAAALEEGGAVVLRGAEGEVDAIYFARLHSLHAYATKQGKERHVIEDELERDIKALFPNLKRFMTLVPTEEEGHFVLKGWPVWCKSSTELQVIEDLPSGSRLVPVSDLDMGHTGKIMLVDEYSLHEVKVSIDDPRAAGFKAQLEYENEIRRQMGLPKRAEPKEVTLTVRKARLNWQAQTDGDDELRTSGQGRLKLDRNTQHWWLRDDAREVATDTFDDPRSKAELARVLGRDLSVDWGATQ